MKLPIKKVNRTEMMKRVAYFKDLVGFDGGLPDSHYPGAERTIYNVLGFQPPENEEGDDLVSPVGSDAAVAAAIPIAEGFNIGYVECEVGKGALMHNHDTNETFIGVTGRWKILWEVDDAVESLEIGPLDVISIPAGVNRSFVNITEGDAGDKHIMIGIIGGNNPSAEFSDKAMDLLREKGLV